MKRNRLALVGLGLLLAAVGGWYFLRGKDKGKATVAAAAGGGTAGRSSSAGRAAIDARTAKRGGIAGHVRDEAGAPVAGANVCSRVIDSDDLSEAETREPSCAISGADGAYAIAGLYAATYGVSASAPKHRPAFWLDQDRKREIQVSPGETRSGIDLVLRAGGVEVKGKVRDISGGGIAEAIVTASSGGWWVAGHGTAIGKSDAEGNFALWVTEGSVSVSATADGYAPGWSQGIAPGQFIEVLLTPESVLVGRVVEAGTDTPIAGARVSAGGGREGWMDWNSMIGSAVTGADGRFRIDRLSPGRYKPEAEAEARYGQARESVLLGLGQTSDEIVIEAHPAVVVSGRVLITPGDAPCEKGDVEIVRKKDDTRDSARVEQDGSFLFKAVMPGAYSIDVECVDKLSEDEYPPVEVRDTDVTDLKLTVREGRALRGEVQTAEGKPVEGASLWAGTTGGDPRGQQARGWDSTDEKGKFELKGLLAGKYRVEVHTDEGIPPEETTVVEVAADRDTEGVVIKLAGGGTITGTVVDEDGAPQSGVNVSAEGRDRWRWGGGDSTSTRDDGSFTLEHVSPGELRVIARRGWIEDLRAPGKGDDDVQGERVTLRAGETKTVRLVVERQSGEIHGKVTDASGAAVVDAFVSGQRESEGAGAAAGSALRQSRWQWGQKPVVTDVEGAFVLPKLSPGKYALRAYRKGGGEGIVEHVAVGSTATIVISTPGSIAGTVVSPGASPPERFQISLYDRQTGFRRSEAFFRTSGTWAMRDLPAGKYEVSLSAQEGQAVAEVPLAVGQHKAGVILEVQALASLRGSVVDLETAAPVPGMRMMVQAIKGGGRFRFGSREDDKKRITGTDGRYEIEDAPAGKVRVNAFPVDFEASEYGWGNTIVEARAGEVTEVPVIKMVKRRMKVQERPGDLGFELKESEPTADPELTTFEVALVRPDGPAAKSGLQVGDVFVSVDGHDVTGPDRSLFWQLAAVREGTTVTFGLARGATVQITAAKPL